LNFSLLSISESIEHLLADKQAFVFYKKPNFNKVTAFVQNNTKLNTTKDYTEQGFVFAPFDKKQEAVLIPSNASTLHDFDLPTTAKIDENLPEIESDVTKNKYTDLIDKSIEFIHSRKVDKIVLSRKINRKYQKEQLGLIYENLVLAYPSAFVYVWHHPEVGLWMGASPEKLLCVEKDAFSTMALAGTQIYKEEVVWGTKEIEEQQWVTDFITDQLIPIAEHLDISKPYTEQAGNLAHIRTDVFGYLNEGTTLQHLIKSIHPTPAVCGTPRNIAEDFIVANENYNRKFYTGFIGEINLDQKTDLYVNLRCMELKNTVANLYVGGGVTIDSNPEKEWEETVNKAAVLGKFLA